MESPSIPISSVGESTNTITRRFHQLLGIDELDFMREVGATYKVSIQFNGFRRRGHTFYHSFGPARREVLGQAQAQASYASTEMSRTNCFDPGQTRYGYHVDAMRYARFLRGYAEERGVGRVEHTVQHVGVAGGRIEHVDGMTADLFVDCTGFRSRLLGEALGEPFVSASDRLVTDRAVVLSLPYDDPTEQMHPYTSCTAMRMGWVWGIPLWERRSYGYVYSSKLGTEAQATAELREHLKIGEAQPVRILRFPTGRRARAWVGNCVAVGLAASFIEPLESTGISLTEASVMELGARIEALDADAYNQHVAAWFDGTADFIHAHYLLSERSADPLWRLVRDTQPSEPLAHILREARAGRTEALPGGEWSFYQQNNWNLVLSGMGVFDEPGADVPQVPCAAMQNHHAYLEAHVHQERCASSS